MAPKRAVGLELSFGGLRAQRAAHGNKPKEKTSPTAPPSLCSSFELMKEMKKKRANEASGANECELSW